MVDLLFYQPKSQKLYDVVIDIYENYDFSLKYDIKQLITSKYVINYGPRGISECLLIDEYGNVIDGFIIEPRNEMKYLGKTVLEHLTGEDE